MTQPCNICGGIGEHYGVCREVAASTPDPTAAIVAWLRRPDAQNWIINLTCAARNGDVRNAMWKCAEIIEAGQMDTPITANGMYRGDQS